jgi:uncharacterized protein (TIGR02118 family)
MPAIVTILYPQKTKFNMDYYLSSHIPMVQKRWTDKGMKSFAVVKLPNDAPYSVQAVSEWESVEHFQSVTNDTTVMDDIVNFSDQTPTFMAGEVVFKT